MTVLILFIALFFFFVLGVPIAYALGLSSALVLFLNGTNMMVIAQQSYGGLNSFTFLCLPFFILAGNLMASGGISRRLINFANAWLGHITGGLAVVAVTACAFFAAVSGSGAATCAAVGAFMIPAMNGKGYHTDLSSATIASAATSGVIIPPSIPMIMYAVSVGCSVGDLFIGGILPGLLYCGGLAILAIFRCKKRNYPLEPKTTWGQRGTATIQAVLALMMPVIILGGIYGGIFTATEAAVVAVVYGLIVGIFIYRELRWKELKSIFLDSAGMAGSLLCMIGIANLFGYVLTRERVPQELTEFFMTVISSKITFLLIVNILFLIIGCIMDTGPAIIVLAPILAPVALAYGIDVIHFGVIMIMNCAIGMITPPFGLCLFVITSISKEKFMNVFKKTVPCMLVMLAVLMVVTYWPPLTMTLVGMMQAA